MTRKVGTPKGAKARCDELFSRIIRLRDGECRFCLRPPEEVGLQCADIISRRYSGGRTCERNAIALCGGCHHYFTDHPVAFGLWVQSWMGEAAYWELTAAISKVTKMDWNAEKTRLRARLDELLDAA